MRVFPSPELEVQSTTIAVQLTQNAISKSLEQLLSNSITPLARVEPYIILIMSLRLGQTSLSKEIRQDGMVIAFLVTLHN